MSKRLRLYRPSCGSEGADFRAFYCDHCEHDRQFRENRAPAGCEIIVRAMVYHTDDKEYPREWRYDGEGHPYCTKFKDSDEGGDEHKRPRPIDPNQFVLIVDPSEDLAQFPSLVEAEVYENV